MIGFAELALIIMIGFNKMFLPKIFICWASICLIPEFK